MTNYRTTGLKKKCTRPVSIVGGIFGQSFGVTHAGTRDGETRESPRGLQGSRGVLHPELGKTMTGLLLPVVFYLLLVLFPPF